MNAIVARVVALAVTGAAPGTPLGAATPGVWGYTYPENVTVTICAYRAGANWQAALLTVNGNYSLQTRLLPGVTEVTGPAGNTTRTNYCDQINDLDRLSMAAGTWFMLGAITAHETVHANQFQPALTHATVLPVLQTAIEALTVPHVAGMTQAAAITAIQALPAFAAALTAAQANWLARIKVLVPPDHGPGGTLDRTGLSYVAELGVVNPMITAICAHRRAQGWPACPPLCP